MKQCQPLEEHVQKVRALSVYGNNLFKISHTAEYYVNLFVHFYYLKIALMTQQWGPQTHKSTSEALNLFLSIHINILCAYKSTYQFGRLSSRVALNRPMTLRLQTELEYSVRQLDVTNMSVSRVACLNPATTFPHGPECT